jgi:rhodanese-related sulfurtransferase
MRQEDFPVAPFKHMPLRELTWLTIAVIALSKMLGADARADHPAEGFAIMVPAAGVKRILDNGDHLILIDLRPANEYHKKRLPRAVSIPSTEIEKRLREIPKFGRVILYCACDQQEIADKAIMLRNQGYRNIGVMLEGYPGWVGLGYPVEESRP